MISLHLARWLREAGLEWDPAPGDQFLIPGHGMDDHVFIVSEMVVQVRHLATGTIIALNGTTEWALDSVMLSDALWMPREEQLRAALGDAFVALERHPRGWAVAIRDPGEPGSDDTAGVAATTAVDALATALLVHLEDDHVVRRHPDELPEPGPADPALRPAGRRGRT